ncbi:MAG: SdrD B-like domain-containing protein [Emticicia sp.]|nr:SdrD B-like domain-containing protein [Emticicia sp.]
MKHTPLYRKYKYGHLYLIVGCWLLSFSNTFAQLSGTVFKDFNNDGFQTPPHELGMRNIVVSIYSSSFATIVKQTDTNGNYSFSAQEVPVGSKVRVEFTGLGANNDGKKAGSSNTSVQFLTVPNGGASNINLGILTHTDYCQVEEALIFTPCYVKGDALGGGSAGEDDAFVSLPYDASGVAGKTGPMPVHIAKASEVGSLWGMDYQARGKVVLTSAVIRRHVGLGPLGTGGIYKFNTLTNILGQLIDVKTLGIDTGPDPHTDLPADKLLTSQDAASVAAAGKVGIGGISLTGDEKTLYMVNLYDRKLYSFFVGSPANTPNIASVKSYTIPNPCPNNTDYRPWGVKEYQGNFYLGVVCTGESSQDSTALSATIYKFNPKTESFSVFYQFPLTYKRGQSDATQDCQNIKYWRPWNDTFPKACASAGVEDGKALGFAINPQPVLSDIEFDIDGSMIIGLMDRFGLIAGFRAMAPVDDGKLYDGFLSGDILRVYNNNGVYEMENNGKAGPLTGSGVNNDEGFGGGEFYGRDYWNFFGNPAHSEVTNGGLMLMPGTGEVLTSAMDPVDEVYHAAGFHIYSNTNGTLLRGFAVYDGKKGTLGKSGGIGDLKSNCGASAIEIGNRIWIDTNINGIQDPDEKGIGGVTVTLHNMQKGGIQVGSTVTSANGEYIFDDSNVSDTVRYENKYQIRVDMSQGAIKNNELINVSPGGNPTLPDEEENPAKMRDSDAKWVKEILPLTNQEGYAIIDFQTGATTLSNHSLDIGLTGCTPPTDVTASSNSPVVEGNTINFTATSTGGSTYTWNGPNGFSSTTQNPSIASATLAASGTYTITVLSSGTCTATATTAVIVTPTCTPPTLVMASSNSPVVEGSSINLTASSTGGSTYTWTGPNGFTSTTQNPSIPTANLTASGTYSVTVLSSGTCTATATTAVIVTPTCTPPTLVMASSNSPVSQGATINFTATSTGGSTYTWNGPNGFTSTTQNPSIPSATLAASGTYSLTVLSSGTCTATATTSVIVTPTCIPPTLVTASSNSPIEDGGTINLKATATGANSYEWTGPNGFTSNLQNPSISSATYTRTGTYNVRAKASEDCSTMVSTFVRVTPPCTIACIPIMAKKVK